MNASVSTLSQNETALFKRHRSNLCHVCDTSITNNLFMGVVSVKNVMRSLMHDH